MSTLNPNNSSGPLIEKNQLNKTVDGKDEKKKKKKNDLKDITK